MKRQAGECHCVGLTWMPLVCCRAALGLRQLVPSGFFCGADFIDGEWLYCWGRRGTEWWTAGKLMRSPWPHHVHPIPQKQTFLHGRPQGIKGIRESLKQFNGCVNNIFGTVHHECHHMQRCGEHGEQPRGLGDCVHDSFTFLSCFEPFSSSVSWVRWTHGLWGRKSLSGSKGEGTLASMCCREEDNSDSMLETVSLTCFSLLLLLSVQFSRSVLSDSLQLHGLQHLRFPCPSPIPGAYSHSCPSSRWCYPSISSSVIPFSSHLQSLPASGSFYWVHSLNQVAKLLFVIIIVVIIKLKSLLYKIVI